MTDRIDPAETEKIWEGLKDMCKRGLLRPIIYDKEYMGLESVVPAMEDLASRKVWGKAVIRMDDDGRARL
jgi:NADPH2:quinone reductase